MNIPLVPLGLRLGVAGILLKNKRLLDQERERERDEMLQGWIPSQSTYMTDYKGKKKKKGFKGKRFSKQIFGMKDHSFPYKYRCIILYHN